MDSQTPIISIVFPSYNGEKYLNKNLDSIKNLSKINEIELIIIDNNSNDSSVEIIKSYEKYINIKLIKQKKNLGFAKACNIGALIAKGKFIFTTNQDVIFPPDFFLKLKEIYRKNKTNQEIIISPAVVFEGDVIHYFGGKIHFLGFSYNPDEGQKLPKRKIVKITPRITGCTLYVKRKLFLEMGGYDARLFMYCEDTDLSLRFLRKGYKIYTTNDPYQIHQKHGNILSNVRYYLLERNRIIVFLKNVANFKKIFPFFLITEVVLLFQSITIKKFNVRIRIYYDLFTKRKFLKEMRIISKNETDLFPYQNLSKTLDSVLIGNLKHNIIYDKLLNLLNFFLKLI